MATKNYNDLSHDELVRLLEARDRRDATRFGLVWEANEIERDKALNKDFVALDLDKSLSVGSGPWRNLIIEGDNFDALRYLRMTFAGRVKCIYIDPPYNTGNRDFVYNDRFVEKEDLWRHSKWCEFMFQRLTLAKDLLRQDGVIFVSIDDNELHHLGLLMSRIFGYGNFVANIIWQKRTSPDMRLDFSTGHEYVVVFAINAQQARFKRTPKTPKQISQYKNPDNDPRGPWVSSDYTAQGFRPNQMYKITTPGGNAFEPPTGVCWKNVESVFLDLVRDNRIWFGRSGKSMPRRKTFLSESEGNALWTWWSNEEVGHNQEAKKELDDILGADQPFDTPKPVRLVERMIASVTNADDLVLDFFAGSGTTAHALHKLNAEDGGKRRCILVSSAEATAEEPEKNLCRDVCARRVRRVIEGYGDTPGLGGDFAYLRCRRIAPGRLMEIDHAQVWTALQLIHCETLGEYRESAMLRAGDEDQLLIYVPRFRRGDAGALRKAVRESRAVIVYSWQPELIRQRLRDETHVQVEAVPESLARRFGMKV
jgi:adenine-specific DNA-methyltransferase